MRTTGQPRVASEHTAKWQKWPMSHWWQFPHSHVWPSDIAHCRVTGTPGMKTDTGPSEDTLQDSGRVAPFSSVSAWIQSNMVSSKHLPPKQRLERKQLKCIYTVKSILLCLSVQLRPYNFYLSTLAQKSRFSGKANSYDTRHSAAKPGLQIQK